MSTSPYKSRLLLLRRRISHWGRLCAILFRRIRLQSARSFRSRYAQSTRTDSRIKTGGIITRKLRALRLTTQIRLHRLRVPAIKQPGWILATITGTLGILLLLIVQVMAFFPGSKSDALFEPIVDTTSNNFGEDYEEPIPLEKHAALIPSENEPLLPPPATAELDLDIILLPDQNTPEPDDQFLVTSVHRLHPLADLAVHHEDDLWQPIRFSQTPSEIQPTQHQTFPENTETPQPGFRLHSSIATSAMTQVAIPRLHLEVTFPDKSTIEQPSRIHFRIVNTGDTSAKNVTVGIEIPETFTYHKGRSLEYNFGTLPPGETRLARLTPIADQTGPAEFEIELTADAGFSKILHKQAEVISR